jgi:hypothetical protein
VLKRQGFFQLQNKFDRTMKIHSKIIIIMDNILSRFIYEQNKDLLERIAKDKFTTDEERHGFIKKYHKLNYAHLNTVKKDNLESYQKKFARVMR